MSFGLKVLYASAVCVQMFVMSIQVYRLDVSITDDEDLTVLISEQAQYTTYTL